MKFLKAVRLDDTDSRVFGATGAATEAEWVVSGGYAVSGPATGRRGPLTHRDNTFIGVTSHGRCSIAEVCEIDAATYRGLIEQLAAYFLNDLGAPSPEAARAAAEDECAYSADLCESFSSEVWITVKREETADGVGERYSVFKRLMIGAHKL
jgi:hypothetical protein